MVDRGTWCAVEKETTERMRVFAESFNAEESDPLINPAHALVGTLGKNKETAQCFVDWLEDTKGGQSVIDTFAIRDNLLYARAPSGVDPLGRAGSML